MIAEYEQQPTSTSSERLRRDGTKREEIERVSAALFIVEQHVRNLRQLRQDESFDNSLSSLAEHVCSFTENKVLASNTAKVPTLSLFICLLYPK